MPTQSFENGVLVYSDVFSKRCFYDISNNLLTAQFDGTGGISKYAVVRRYE